VRLDSSQADAQERAQQGLSRLLARQQKEERRSAAGEVWPAESEGGGVVERAGSGGVNLWQRLLEDVEQVAIVDGLAFTKSAGKLFRS
jgi:hypothetical protein